MCWWYGSMYGMVTAKPIKAASAEAALALVLEVFGETEIHF